MAQATYAQDTRQLLLFRSTVVSFRSRFCANDRDWAGLHTASLLAFVPSLTPLIGMASRRVREARWFVSDCERGRPAANLLARQRPQRVTGSYCDRLCNPESM